MRRRRRSLLREYLEAFLVAVLLATFTRTWLVQAFRIPTGSMEQNLRAGDHVLVNKFVHAPTRWAWEDRWLPVRPVARGEVVVFRYPPDPSRDFIKRCVALPGDRVRLAAKQLYVNGEPVDETAYAWASDPQTYPDSPLLDDYFRRRDNFGPVVVPPGQFFFLGDNRDLSHDSRFWGMVSRDLLSGQAVLVYWSVPPGEPEEGASFVAGLVRAPRWDRFLRFVQ